MDEFDVDHTPDMYVNGKISKIILRFSFCLDSIFVALVKYLFSKYERKWDHFHIWSLVFHIV